MSAGIEEIAARVREARIAKALTQKELGSALAYPKPYLQNRKRHG